MAKVGRGQRRSWPKKVVAKVGLAKVGHSPSIRALQKLQIKITDHDVGRDLVVATRIKWTATPASSRSQGERQTKASKEQNPEELRLNDVGGLMGQHVRRQSFPQVRRGTAQRLSEEPPSVGRPGHHGNVSQHVTLPRVANLHGHPGAHNLLVLVPRVWRLLPLLATKVVRIRGRPGGFWLRRRFAQVGSVWVAFQSGGKPLCHLGMTLSGHGHAVCPTRPSPRPPMARGSVATSCVSWPHVERSTWRILLRHSDKPASWRPACFTDIKK